MAPWKLARGDDERLDTVLYTLAEIERLVAVALWSFMPTTSERILDQLGSSGRLSTSWGETAPGTKLTSQPQPLFPRMEVGVAAPH